MTSKQDVEKLASLARLALTDAEVEKFQGEMDAILGFVAKVKDAAEAAPKPSYPSINQFREDAVIHGSSEYTEKLLSAAPGSEGEYVKVKRILE
jgi:aspartyl-tRNA(Asn)/glutamyl-tRNA(Gln) amidotransferase subunit C